MGGKYRKAIKKVREKQAFEKEQEQLHKKYNQESQNTVIKEKTNMVKFAVRSISALVRIIATILLICLASVGLLTLLYPNIRSELYALIIKLMNEVSVMLH